MVAAKAFGTWESPITAKMLVGGAKRLGEIVVDGDDVWWSESRPEESGRNVLVKNGVDQLHESIDVRTLTHEYGGAAWQVRDGLLVYSNYADQRLYLLDLKGETTPLTPEPSIPKGDRYADGCITNDGYWYVCVRERHSLKKVEASNEIIAVALDGSQQVVVLVSGLDFVSSPRLSPKGNQIAWVQWDHPQMPWDETKLYVASLQGMSISEPKCVLPGSESFFQPSWSENGVLHVVSDRNGWWNLYRINQGDKKFSMELLIDEEAEIGLPQWVFGQSRYAFVGKEIWFVRRKSGIDYLAIFKQDKEIEEIELGVTEIEAVCHYGDGIVGVVSSWSSEPSVVLINRSRTEVLSETRNLGLSSDWFPIPDAFTFPTSDGEEAHALFYPPTNPKHRELEGEVPPLLVLAHGGPTGAARRQLQLSISFWTSRGFGVVDVDYRGSTGYGRSFRNSLRKSWGVKDVDDCVAVTTYLIQEGKADKNRLAIKGGSAGGFTVLAALTLHDIFTAGACRYGVADLATLAKDTHKFESRYLDGLIGEWPEQKEIYEQRSPINQIEKLSTPMIILQGSEDSIVPPNQAHLMASQLDKKGIPFSLLEFPDEGHGFRKASNIIRAIEAELNFFARIFGFQPFDVLPELEIQNELV